MPALIDPRQEAFAQARARGLHRMAAAAEAGYRDNGSKLAKRPHVVARIAELQENIALVRRADHAGTVADLTRLADALVALNTPASLKEALVVRKQAHVMYASFGVDLQHDCADPVIPDAIWMERFSPNREDDAPRPRRRRRRKDPKRGREISAETENPGDISFLEQNSDVGAQAPRRRERRPCPWRDRSKPHRGRPIVIRSLTGFSRAAAPPSS